MADSLKSRNRKLVWNVIITFQVVLEHYQDISLILDSHLPNHLESNLLMNTDQNYAISGTTG